MGNGLTTRTFKIEGMTCVNCQNKIENKLKSTKGILSAQVNYSKQTGIVTFNPEVIRFSTIEMLIENLHYKIKAPAKSENRIDEKINTTVQILGAVFIILALYMVMSRLGILNIFNSFPEAKVGMGYSVLFVIGLLTSVHCIAMCGGINLSQCVSNQLETPVKKKNPHNLKPGILYNTGRVISYTVIGGIVGGLGSVVSFSGTGRGIVAIFAGVFMVIMGLNMLNIFPSLRKFNPRMPKIFASKINNEKSRNSPLYVGLLNGLMPCGPLQAMQLYALSTGDPVKGALAMLAFSLGTVPLMFGLGALSSILTKKFTGRMMTVSAMLVVILGVFMFSNGMSLSGYQLAMPAIGFSNNTTEVMAASAETIDGVQTVTTKLTSRGYEPISVKAGIPVKWNIQAAAEDINGCNGTIIIPAYNIEKSLEPGDNIIEFTPAESGTIPFSCWMGMINSQINVI
ncbi:MAG: sulfite exporter TauE/SafE family protein [Peptostreptococcaceae bacterium]|nr:sulfite exporter TauE/SafE family protein [Peptostreptococcaceae bacterium]